MRPATATGAGGGVHHRVAPAPVSSGVSFRALPAPSLLQLIKLCQHHEAKVAAASAAPGASAAASAAARHVYDLSREVQDVVRALKAVDDQSQARILELEATLRDWNEVFAMPSRALQQAGVARGSNAPAAVARLVLRLADAARGAELEQLAQRAQLEREAGDMRRALRDAGRVQREQCADELGRLKDEADAAIARERAARALAEESLARCEAAADAEVARRSAEDTDRQTAQLRAELARVRRAAEEEVTRAYSAAHALEDAAEDARNELAAQQELAQRQLSAAAAVAARFSGLLAQHEEGAEAAATEAAELLSAREALWRQRLTDTTQRWERSTGAARTVALENQVLFLSGRVGELQQLCDAMQRALHMQRQLAQPVNPTRGVGDGSESRSFFQDVLDATAASAASSVGGARTLRPPPAPSVVFSTLRGAAPRGLRTVATVRHASSEAVLGPDAGPAAASVAAQTHYLSTR